MTLHNNTLLKPVNTSIYVYTYDVLAMQLNWINSWVIIISGTERRNAL